MMHILKIIDLASPLSLACRTIKAYLMKGSKKGLNDQREDRQHD